MPRNSDPYTPDEFLKIYNYYRHGANPPSGFVVNTERWIDTIIELNNTIKEFNKKPEAS